MDPTNIASIIISVIAAVSAIASQRQAAKASTTNARASAETDSYVRARKMDIETIERQDEEIAELRAENKLIRTNSQELEDEVIMLRKRVSRLEPDEEMRSLEQ